jgi:cytosine/adenosine deaminase-related metal-dependent hydrolase
MNERMTVTRRTLMNTAAAASAAGLLGGIAQAQAPTTNLPAANEVLIHDAFVISMDPSIGDLPHGDIHIRDGAIVAVAANLNAPGAQVIDGRDMIACPGFIETHWHMWGAVARNMAGEEQKTGYFPLSRVLGSQFTPEDNARGVRLALAEAISSGITTLHNWSHNLLTPAYVDAELAVHREVGGRARFAYGYSRNTKADETLPLDDVVRVQRQYFSGPAGLLTLGIASRGPEQHHRDLSEGMGDRAQAGHRNHYPCRHQSEAARHHPPHVRCRPTRAGCPGRPRDQHGARQLRSDGQDQHAGQPQPLHRNAHRLRHPTGRKFYEG